MSKIILRGRALSFVNEPQGISDSSSYRYFEDGAVVVSDGKIVALDDFDQISHGFSGEIIDHRPCLILPGLIDPHIHYVQMQIIASYAANLMEWLNKYTFVEEQKFADFAHASKIAQAFFDTLIRHGTTTAAAYCSVHAASAEAFFTEAQKRNMAMIGGKCMMDTNCPEALRDTAQKGYDQTKALIEKWHANGRNLYAITPRFAITSTHEQMEAVQALIGEFPDAYVQTHLAENDQEIAFTKELYPGHEDYLGIYQHYGLLGPKSLFGHSIHLNEREIGAMAETRSVAVSCPTSNLFLGSGLFAHDRLKKAGVAIGVATDIGGGTSFSMFKTLDEFYKVQQLNGSRFDPLSSFYLMTLGNARALSLAEKIGTLAPGSDADIVVLDPCATPEMALRHQTVTDLGEELFLLQTLGDERAVVETYVAGKAMKSGIG